MEDFKLRHLAMCLIAVLLFSCDSDKYNPHVEKEAKITAIKIMNGGMSGEEELEGVINNTDFSIVFDNVPVETDIDQLKFTGRLSLGATLDKKTFDFSKENPQIIRVANGDLETEYLVELKLLPVQEKPVLSRVITVMANGEEIRGVIKQDAAPGVDSLLLDSKGEDRVFIQEVTTRPLRATYKFTEGTGTVVSKDSPGDLIVDFMGKQTVYKIGFIYIPPTGIEVDKKSIFDFSPNPIGEPLFPDFTGLLTRNAGYDGKYVLVVNRGARGPLLLPQSSVTTPASTGEIKLNQTGIAGGIFTISGGRVSHGRTYICNLTGDIKTSPFNLYYWETPTSTPEKIAAVTSAAGVGRYGDFMNLQLDDNGNGFLFASQNAPGEMILKLPITNWKTVGEPTFLKLGASGLYGAFNRVDNDDPNAPVLDEFIYSNRDMGFQLVTGDGKVLAEVPNGTFPQMRDVRLFTFNGQKYLMGGTAKPSANLEILLYEVKEGDTSLQAMEWLKENKPDPIFTHSLDAAPHTAAPTISTSWANVDGDLYIFVAGTDTGFAVIKFARKVD